MIIAPADLISGCVSPDLSLKVLSWWMKSKVTNSFFLLLFCFYHLEAEFLDGTVEKE